MSDHLNKQDLTRLAWLTELRRQGHRQCADAFDDDHGNVMEMNDEMGLTFAEIADAVEGWFKK